MKDPRLLVRLSGPGHPCGWGHRNYHGVTSFAWCLSPVGCRPSSHQDPRVAYCSAGMTRSCCSSRSYRDRPCVHPGFDAQVDLWGARAWWWTVPWRGHGRHHSCQAYILISVCPEVMLWHAGSRRCCSWLLHPLLAQCKLGDVWNETTLTSGGFLSHLLQPPLALRQGWSECLSERGPHHFWTTETLRDLERCRWGWCPKTHNRTSHMRNLLMSATVAAPRLTSAYYDLSTGWSCRHTLVCDLNELLDLGFREGHKCVRRTSTALDRIIPIFRSKQNKAVSWTMLARLATVARKYWYVPSKADWTEGMIQQDSPAHDSGRSTSAQIWSSTWHRSSCIRSFATPKINTIRAHCFALFACKAVHKIVAVV